MLLLLLPHNVTVTVTTVTQSHNTEEVVEISETNNVI